MALNLNLKSNSNSKRLENSQSKFETKLTINRIQIQILKDALKIEWNLNSKPNFKTEKNYIGFQN